MAKTKKERAEQAMHRLKLQRGLSAKIARRLKLYPSSLSRWKRVPAGHVAKVAEITGLSREQLRPDLY